MNASISETEGDLKAEVVELRGEVASLECQVADGADEINRLEGLKDEGPLSDAIDALLDLVERPTGTLRASLPATPATERALINLSDIMGRTL